MANPLDILRKGKEGLEELDDAFKEGIDLVREVLPFSRGGSKPDKSEPETTGPRPVPLRDVPETPSYALTQESAAFDSPASGFARAFERKRMRDEQMKTEDTIRNMVNDPMVTVTSDMLDIINDPSILMDANFQLFRNQFARSELLREEPKKKRKVSKYQKELGRQLKMLKKKHPRTRISALMKRAHRLTRKALK